MSEQEKLQHRINFLEQNETVVWEVLKIADGSTIHDVVAAVQRLQSLNAKLLAACEASCEILIELRDKHLNHTAAVTRAIVQKRIEVIEAAVAEGKASGG